MYKKLKKSPKTKEVVVKHETNVIVNVKYTYITRSRKWNDLAATCYELE